MTLFLLTKTHVNVPQCFIVVKTYVTSLCLSVSVKDIYSLKVYTVYLRFKKCKKVTRYSTWTVNAA